MTATHVSYETLADLAEGLLGEVETETANDHLAECRICRDRAAELMGVTRILATARPPSMPPDLQVRLNAALAAEARTRTPHRARPRRNQLVAAAAVAAVAVVGGAVAVANLSGAPTGLSSATNSQADEPPTHFAPQQENPNLRAGGAPSANNRAYPVLADGTAFTSAGLAAQVRRAVDGARPTGSTNQTTPGLRLAQCVDRVVGPARRPLLVEEGTYDGAPAEVIVAANGVMSLDVWVVGQACSGTDSDILTQLSTTR
jgi:hypothetical protein